MAHLQTPDPPLWRNCLTITDVVKPVLYPRNTSCTMKGVVATTFIPAHTRLGNYCGFSSNESDNHYKTMIQTEEYDLGAISPYCNETQSFFPPFEDYFANFINEASKPGEFPNCAMTDNYVLQSVDFVTIRDIYPGEELVTYYGPGHNEFNSNYSRAWLKEYDVSKMNHITKPWGQIRKEGWFLPPFLRTDEPVPLKEIQ